MHWFSAFLGTILTESLLIQSYSSFVLMVSLNLIPRALSVNQPTHLFSLRIGPQCFWVLVWSCVSSYNLSRKGALADTYLAPWGGHGVFPNIYRDMRHPRKYGKSLWATYLFTVRYTKSIYCCDWLTDEWSSHLIVQWLLSAGSCSAILFATKSLPTFSAWMNTQKPSPSAL